MKDINTWHIHIKGQVQGVGFRPFVYQLAHEMSLTGWVNNDIDGVHIEVNADKKDVDKFYSDILSNAPPLSHILSHSIQQKPTSKYEDFKITGSQVEGDPTLQLSPDFSICEQCRREINDKTSRRIQYAFTTCTQCGPRYSIIHTLPYDRENTAMNAFTMCRECKNEYVDPANRRHFSQTNSCPYCEVKMELYDTRQNLVESGQEKIISKIAALLEEGNIIAIKGIGGYLLCCDATNAKTIHELRERKQRPSKPFGLMYPNAVLLKGEVHLSEVELSELQTPMAPIVLLYLKKKTGSNLLLNEISPSLSKIGVMIPYTPFYELLLNKFSKPIVATSGNISNSPIISDDNIALKQLNALADYVLIHNREIIFPQDDSVVAFSPFFKQRIIFRRSRGFAPFYSNKYLKTTEKTLLATGALLKSSFSLMHQQNIHISQYLGDLENYDSENNFEKTIHSFLTLFSAKPQCILVDKHPGYFSTQLGKKLAAKWGSLLISIQHHEAHFASVLGEHNLMNETEPILGVVWDGTGLGNDGEIWGGEFFIFHQNQFSRAGHVDYFNHFLGDKMAIEPRLSAFSLAHDIEKATAILQEKFSPIEWQNYLKLISSNKLKTSSVGRVFDAVASLLGIIDKSSYEGEAAMLLEEEALGYFKNGLNIPAGWSEYSGSTRALITGIVNKVNRGDNKSEIAAWFHVQLVALVQTWAEQAHCNKICFSGGVFQNGLLIDLLTKVTGSTYKLYFNHQLSPNDENISFGQLIWYLNRNNVNL